MPTAGVAKIDKHELKFSNLDKVLYPQAGFTKGQVIDYYLRIAPVLLPHLQGRPITLKRYPNGVDGMFFYEKRCPAHKPDWVKTASIYSRHNEDNINYCLAPDRSTLAWLANLACLELHPLLAKSDKPDVPTTMVFDLDPGPPASILDCIRIALKMRDSLKHLGLESFPKTSGGKGLHFWVPLNTPVSFDQTKAFAHTFAMFFERQDPEHVTSVMRKDLRVGKVLIDWSQNDSHKTTVAAYSLRAQPQPTVSTPVTWKELESALKRDDGTKLRFTADQVLKRVEKLGDLFEPVLKLKQKLDVASSVSGDNTKRAAKRRSRSKAS